MGAAEMGEDENAMKRRRRSIIFPGFEAFCGVTELVDERGEPVDVKVDAQLQGSFEEGEEGEGGGVIICYKRNHFKVTLNVRCGAASGGALYIRSSPGRLQMVKGLYAVIGAVSQSDNDVAIMQTPPSRDRNLCRPPAIEPIPGPWYGERSVSWRRLQFSSSTYNMPRRRPCDERSFYRLRVTLAAELEPNDADGNDPNASAVIGIIQTRLMIVRGRAPNFFKSQGATQMHPYRGVKEREYEAANTPASDLLQDGEAASRIYAASLTPGEHAAPASKRPAAYAISSIIHSQLSMPQHSFGMVAHDMPDVPLEQRDSDALADTSGYSYHPLERRYLSAPVEIFYSPHSDHHLAERKPAWIRSQAMPHLAHIP